MGALGWAAKIRRSLHETWEVGTEARPPLEEQAALTRVTSAIMNDAQISRKNDPPRLHARVSESNLRSLRPLHPGDRFGQKHPLRRTPRLPIPIADRSVMARSSQCAELKCAESSSATGFLQTLPQVSLAPFGIPDISRKPGDRHFRMAKTSTKLHTG